MPGDGVHILGLHGVLTLPRDVVRPPPAGVHVVWALVEERRIRAPVQDD
jgi:hypothetical protein